VDVVADAGAVPGRPVGAGDQERVAIVRRLDQPGQDVGRPVRAGPVRNAGSAPIGLKYRSDSTRSGYAREASASTSSIMALPRTYGLAGAIGERSSTMKSAAGW
jgi:hypothetical protein